MPGRAAGSTAAGDSCSVELVDLSDQPLPASIDFVPDYQCSGPQVKQFHLRNNGGFNESATLRFAVRQAFSITPATPQSLPAGGPPVTISIAFDPGVAGAYLDTLIITSRYCNRELRIPMSGERSALSYSVSSLKFGGVSVGYPATMSAKLTNTSPAAKITISGAYIRPAGGPFTIVSSSFPVTLDPGATASVDVTYAPVTGRADTADFIFVLEAPCPKEVSLRMTGSGVQSSVRLKADTIRFGTVYGCEEGLGELEIQNIGSGSFQVKNLLPGGNDPGAFQQVTPISFPFTIDPGGSLKVPFRFIPGRANHDGTNIAQVNVITSDSAKGSIPVTFIADLSRAYLDAPAKLDFGRVSVGFTGDQDLVLTNQSTRSLHIDSIVAGAPFNLLAPAAPLDVPPAGSITLKLRFTPVDSNRARAPLTIYYGSPCFDSSVVLLIGNGKLVPVGQATILLPRDLGGLPGDRISVPIVLTASSQLRESESTTFRAVLRFNRTMLLPLGARPRYGNDPSQPALSGSAKLSHAIKQGDQVLTLEIRNAPVPVGPDTLGWLDLMVLLGDSSTTPLHLDTLFWTDGDVVVARTDGLFTSGACGDRRAVVDGSFGVKSAVPNPFNPSTTIRFETVEDGATTLAIYDPGDRLVATLLDHELLPVGPHELVWQARDVSSGVYHVVMTTPARRSVYRLVLIK